VRYVREELAVQRNRRRARLKFGGRGGRFVNQNVEVTITMNDRSYEYAACLKPDGRGTRGLVLKSMTRIYPCSLEGRQPATQPFKRGVTLWSGWFVSSLVSLEDVRAEQTIIP
jgi:hypothetical protein